MVISLPVVRVNPFALLSATDGSEVSTDDVIPSTASFLTVLPLKSMIACVVATDASSLK